MAGQFRCGIRMEGSGAGATRSSPNCEESAGIGTLSATDPPAAGGPGTVPAETIALEDGSDAAGRGALAAGHPLSWSLLTAGTVLDGTAYADLP